MSHPLLCCSQVLTSVTRTSVLLSMHGSFAAPSHIRVRLRTRTICSANHAYTLLSADCGEHSGGLGSEPNDPPEARNESKNCEFLYGGVSCASLTHVVRVLEVAVYLWDSMCAVVLMYPFVIIGFGSSSSPIYCYT